MSIVIIKLVLRIMIASNSLNIINQNMKKKKSTNKELAKVNNVEMKFKTIMNRKS